jgi:hypothetical protein
MKKLIFTFALLLLFGYGSHLRACDCDPASALLWGMKDRLHQPWPDDPERAEKKVNKSQSNNTDNAPKQEVQPSSPDFQKKGDAGR